MRNTVLFAALALLLSACATLRTSPTPTSTVAATVTPTLLPSPTPAPTLTPSPTVDPNMPPDATGKDAEGNYTKVENRLTVVWNPELKAWERHLNANNEGIPLIVLNDAGHAAGYKDLISLYVNIGDSVPGFEKVASIGLHPGVGEYPQPGKPGWKPNFNDQFGGDLVNTLYRLNRSVEPSKFGTALQNGEFSLQFTTSERPDPSSPWVWKISPDTKVIVDILDAPVGNGFSRKTNLGVYDGIDGPDQTRYQIRVFTDDQGNLHQWIVPGKPLDQLKEEQLLEMYLYAPACLAQFAAINTDRFCEHLVNYIQLLTKPAYLPFLDFGPPR